MFSLAFVLTLSCAVAPASCLWKQLTLPALRQAIARRAGPAPNPATRVCAPLEDIPIAGANLTAADLDALPDLCWPPGLTPDTYPGLPQSNQARGVPPGIACKVVPWCDSAGHCTDVCARGSVEVDPWLQHALQTQLTLARRLPFCYASLLGTHNSGITLADGYGNLDPQFGTYFQWIRWVTSDPGTLLTNDQWLSLSDQLALGVRVLELDTHWFGGDMRIAHCGGYHSDFDALIKAINVVAKLLHHDIQWDSETIGCSPSLSSIPTLEQRTLTSAMQEVRDWLQQPQNEGEFVVMFFDDQEDLQAWEMVPALLSRILAVFEVEQIWTPPEMAQVDWRWPSIDELVARGKRVMFISGYDYGREMNSHVFSKGAQVCDWAEPPMRAWQGGPACAVHGWGRGGQADTLTGQLLRIISCELTYGPMNCDFVWGASNDPLLNEETLPDIARCGLNMPSPDLLTPSKSAATVWTWAQGHPFSPYAEHTWLQAAWLRLLNAATWAVTGRAATPQCAAISASDGRWRAVDCSGSLPSACRASDGSWQLGSGQRGTCPDGTRFEAPHHGKENMALQGAMQAHKAAWLPIEGPDWHIQQPSRDPRALDLPSSI